MSRSVPQIRLRSWKRPPWWRRLLRRCWSAFRVVLVLGAALGPVPPPPPPPQKPVAVMVVAAGKVDEEE